MVDFAWLAGPIGGVGLAIALAIHFRVAGPPAADDAGQEVARRIHAGVRAVLRSSAVVAGAFVLVLGGLLFFALGAATALAFAFGALSSMGVWFLGAMAAARAQTGVPAPARVSEAASRPALAAAVALSLAVASLGVLGVGVLHFFGIFRPGAFTGTEVASFAGVAAGYALGASTVALVVRVGGGIYAQAAAIGAGGPGGGVAGRDAYSPAAVAERVGDSVDSIAGSGADFFESYVASVIATIAIGATSAVFATQRVEAVALPILAPAVGLVASLFAFGVLRLMEGRSPAAALRAFPLVAAALFLAAMYFIVRSLGFELADSVAARIYPADGPFWALLTGSLAGIGVGLATEYFTTARPARRLAESSQSGSATTLVAGLAVGLGSTAVSTFLIAAAVWFAFFFSGAYGVGMAAVGMLATVGAATAAGTYGSIVRGVGVSGTKAATGALQPLIPAAAGRGHAVGAAALTAFALLSAYAERVGLRAWGGSLAEPPAVVGLLLGGILVACVGALTMSAAGRAGQSVVEEVRLQVGEGAGSKAAPAEPDPDRWVGTSSRAAGRGIILPAAVAMLAPVLVGYLLGIQALGAMVVGAAVTGIPAALFLAGFSGAREPAAAFLQIDTPEGGGRSRADRAAPALPPAAHPFRDTLGPVLTVVVKVVGVMALVIVSWLVRIS